MKLLETKGLIMNSHPSGGFLDYSKLYNYIKSIKSNLKVMTLTIPLSWKTEE